jgi:hypothetical protein
MKSGHRGVFLRSGKMGRRGNPKLEKIKDLWTTRISDSMQDAGAIPAVQATTSKAMESVFLRGLKRELAKGMRKGLA